MSISPRLALSALAGLALFAGVAAPAGATGLLVPSDRGLEPLSLKHQRVEIEVKDGTAVTKVEQVFVNHTNRQLEASYYFPVPEDAVIVDFKLMIAGKMQRGEVLPKDKANRIYTDIVRRMADPGILDWMSPTLFKARIFPVPARGEQKVELSYTQVLPILDGTYKVHYPLKTPARAATTLEDFTLTTRIHHSIPLRAVYSPSHRVSVGRKGEHDATVGFEGNTVTLDKDFVLYFGISKEDVGLSLLTHKEPGEPGYFMLTAAPKAVWQSEEVQGKAVTFVLDTSGSMQGAKLEHAKSALRWTIDQLGHDDRFNIIRFSSDVERLSDVLESASSANKDKARRFVDGFEAAGGTAIDDALHEALSQDVQGATHLVLFITDGRPTVGETQLKKILERAGDKNKHRARVFALGIGDDVNTHLLDQLSDAHGGTSGYVKPTEAIETHIAALYNKIAHPVLTDVRVGINNVRTFAVLPNQVSDLFRGEQITIVGRYRGDGDALVRVTGTMSDRARQFDFEGTFPARRADNAFITKLWAHRQVGFLLDQIRLNGETSELKDEVVQLATKYGIVTPYTSFLVVEDTPLAGGPRPEPRPRPRPRPRRPHWKGGNRGAGGDAPAPAAKVAEEKAAEAEQLILETAKDAGEGFTDKSGKKSVANTKVLKRYKNKEIADDEVATVRNVAGKVFVWRDGRWIDRAFQAGMKTLEIAPYSEAWIRLAQAKPKLKAALALGEGVTVVVGKIAVVVKKGGKSSLSPAELKSLSK